MARRSPPIARIRLARSWPRILTLPSLLMAASVAGIAAAFLLLPGGALRYAAAAAAALPALGGLLLAVRLGTMRVDVEEAAVRVRWAGGSRTYALVPGPVTRVRLRGDQASSLRARTGLLGWQVGSARLRREEPIEVVRLAPTRTAILVPTDRGRLALAAASEPQLLDALSQAARARKRLEDLVGREPHGDDGHDRSDVGDAEDAGEAPGSAADGAPDAVAEPPSHILTGIERAMLDERLARERLEVESVGRPEAEVLALAEARATAQAEAEAAARLEAEAAARLETERADAADGANQDSEADEAMTRVPRIPSVAFVVLPTLATLAVWGAALALERLPEPTTEAGRLTALALVLSGPATSVGVIMARAWWPRLVGVVVTSGLAAAVFVGRSLLGP